MEILRNPALIWFIVGLAMFLIEMAGPGLVFLFFGIGAWVIMALVLFLDISLNVQLSIFLLVSILSLVFFRRGLKKAFHGHRSGEQDPALDLDDFIGKRAVVKEQILPPQRGKIEFKGSFWNAEAEEEIPEGAAVEIISKDSLTLKVKKV